ncbi:MAG: Crp/Fnr family transcriptional regulator [Acidimicrobiia bacterium]
MSEYFEKFVAPYPVKKYKAGETIIFHSEVVQFSYCLYEGTIRVYSLNIDGEETNITYLQKHSFFPIEYIFGKTKASLFYFSAETDCSVAVIPTPDILNEMKTNVDLCSELLDSIVTKYVAAEIHIQAIGQTHAREKIIYILRYLVFRFGVELADNKWLIDFPLRQNEISNIIGVTRETTATELNNLKRSGIISYKSFYYTVDMAMLNNLLGDKDEVNL